MGCGDILPNVSVTPDGEGFCRIDSHHLRGAVIDEAGIIQVTPPGVDPSLVGLQARECARNPAVDYYRVDLREAEGRWLSLSGEAVRALSGEISGVTPARGPRNGRRGTSDPVTLNAHADGASLCISTAQQGPIHQSLERLVGTVYGESSYCRSLFGGRQTQLCGIFVPELQRVYNSHPERIRDGHRAPQSMMEEYGSWLLGAMGSLIGGWLGLEGVAYMFGHRVHQWSARYAVLQAGRNAATVAEGTALAQSGVAAENAAGTEVAASATRRSLLGRLFTGAANVLTRVGNFFTTPILFIDPCSTVSEEDSDRMLCAGQVSGPNA